MEMKWDLKLEEVDTNELNLFRKYKGEYEYNLLINSETISASSWYIGMGDVRRHDRFFHYMAKNAHDELCNAFNNLSIDEIEKLWIVFIKRFSLGETPQTKELGTKFHPIIKQVLDDDRDLWFVDSKCPDYIHLNSYLPWVKIYEKVTLNLYVDNDNPSLDTYKVSLELVPIPNTPAKTLNDIFNDFMKYKALNKHYGTIIHNNKVAIKITGKLPIGEWNPKIGTIGINGELGTYNGI